MLSIFKTDFYKIHHINQYPRNTKFIYANLTPRSFKWFEQYRTKYSWIKKDRIFYSQNLLEYVVEKLREEWNNNFFNVSWTEIEIDIKLFEKNTNLKLNNIVGAYRELHKLGYLPLKIDILDETPFITDGIEANTPLMTIINTRPEFYWLVNYVEVWLSNAYWKLLVVDNIASQLRMLGTRFLSKTYSPEPKDYEDILLHQFHDFSQRGISSHESSVKVGVAHLNHFYGSDTLPSIMERIKYPTIFGNNCLESVVASEHSVMEYGGVEGEAETIERLLNMYPKEPLSLVLDTYNYWNVLTNILPSLKQKIMKRPKKAPLIVRPDSAIPLEVICGKETNSEKLKDTEWAEAELKGTLRLLDETFGHTLTETGHKLLNGVRIIYGDSITVAVAETIFEKMETMGYSTANITFGCGSFLYQFNTRDTMGIAIKTTAIKVGDNDWEMLYKDPITDSGLKKSRKGFINIGTYKKVVDNLISPKELREEQEKNGTLLLTVMKNK